MLQVERAGPRAHLAVQRVRRDLVRDLQAVEHSAPEVALLQPLQPPPRGLALREQVDQDARQHALPLLRAGGVRLHVATHDRARAAALVALALEAVVRDVHVSHARDAAVLGVVDDERVVRQIVRYHGRRVQRVVVEHRHRLLEVHAGLRLQDDRAFVALVVFVFRALVVARARRDQEAVVAAALGDQRKDLDALPAHEDERQRHEAHVGHARVVGEHLELGRETVAQLAVLHETFIVGEEARGSRPPRCARWPGVSGLVIDAKV